MHTSDNVEEDNVFNIMCSSETVRPEKQECNIIDKNMDVSYNNSEENCCVEDALTRNHNNGEENYSIEDALIHNDNNIINKSVNLKKQLKQWVCEYNITHRATGALLKLLKNIKDINELQDLPLDPRTLLSTPKHTVIREVPPG